MSKRANAQRQKERICPLNRNFQAENIVYKSPITCNEQNYNQHIYIGIPEITFKKRYSNHKKSFNLAVYNNDTEFSKKFWKTKRRNCHPDKAENPDKMFRL